jgi:hypothetical protein
VTRATLTLLGKPDCHLCHEMESVAAPILAQYGAALVLRDVRDDAETRRLYLNEIPVLLLGASEVARHRVTPDGLRARLEALGLKRS